MNKRLLILCICCSILLGINAQEIITGTVVDSKRVPIPGVRVEVVGRSETTTTDIDGRFRLDLPQPVKKLRFQYIGQKPIERKVKPDMVVVMGHGWSGRDSGYRGFFTYTGGFGWGGTMNFHIGNASITDFGKNTAMFGISTTHGYQINPKFYVGLGAGLSPLMMYYQELRYIPYNDYSYQNGEYDLYGVAFQFYADFRWDYDIKAKTSPFVDLKMGLQRILSTGDIDGYYYDYYYDNDFDLECQHTSGFLLMPTVGIRTAIGAKRAINFGLSYNIFVKRAVEITTYSYYQLPDGNYINTSYPAKKFSATGGCLLFNFGFDF